MHHRLISGGDGDNVDDGDDGDDDDDDADGDIGDDGDVDGDIGDDGDVEDNILSFSNWHSSYQDNSASSNSNSVKFSEEVDEAQFSDFSETI